MSNLFTPTHADNTITNIDNFENFNNKNNNNYKNSSYLRNQLDNLINQSFLHQNKIEKNIYISNSTITDNNKVNETKSLKNQIIKEEKRINELEKTRQSKLIKVKYFIKIR